MAPVLGLPASQAPGAVAAPAIATTGKLLQRIGMVEQMARSDAADGLQPGVVHALLQRLKQFAGMIDRLGIDDTRGPLVDAMLREAEADCFGCTGAQRCRAWLDAPGLESAYHEFCDNAARFDTLPRRMR